jgi:GDPmannose 4,6-dehydratase
MNTPKMNSVAIVTGITGQDGSYLAEFLLEKGYTVIGLKRRSSTNTMSRIDHIQDPKFSVREYDLCDPLSNSSILSTLDNFDRIEVYNLAAQSHVKTSFDQPWNTFQTNALAVYGWLEAIRQSPLKSKIRFYQAGTSEMFGKVQEIPQKETTPFYPRSPYGVSKLAAFWACKNYRESYGLFVCNGILFNHESERRGDLFVTQKIVNGLLAPRSEWPIRLGNLDAKRDWGHAKDYVRSMWLMLQHDTPDDYVIATGETHSIREFIDEALKHIGLDYRWVGDSVYVDDLELFRGSDPEFMRPSEVDILVGDSSKARKVLGWKPEIDFKQLVKTMIDNHIK